MAMKTNTIPTFTESLIFNGNVDILTTKVKDFLKICKQREDLV